jgi:hypothetical protein
MRPDDRQDPGDDQPGTKRRHRILVNRDLHAALAHDLNALLDWVQSELPATEDGHPERSSTAGRDSFERSEEERRVPSPR